MPGDSIRNYGVLGGGNGAWVKMADRQLDELAEQRAQLDEAMSELKDLRDSVAGEWAAD